MSDYLLTARAIRKVYNQAIKPLEVLKGINLDIKLGEILAIVGPSGAGKSTLLHILGGLDTPSEGEVFFSGKDIYKFSDRQRSSFRNKNVGFVFQFYHLLPEFSAIENVFMPAVIMHNDGSKLRDRAKEILGKLGLAERLNHFPAQLSGGEMQRVAIARALVNEPDVLFCDEPTGNLDSASGEQIKKLLWKINKENRLTIVIVTHDEKLVADADRVLHIRDGLIKEGSL
jgi:lipoprotein-releasing system ATP-binding protein